MMSHYTISSLQKGLTKLKLKIDFSSLKPWETMLYFELLSITEEAYTYFSQCYQIHNLDPRISEPVKVISNIENDLGIVIGANIASDSIINGPPFDPSDYE